MSLKKCLAAISLAIAGSVPVVAGNTYVTIQKNDGTKSSFLLSAVPKITHTADSLKVEEMLVPLSFCRMSTFSNLQSLTSHLFLHLKAMNFALSISTTST